MPAEGEDRANEPARGARRATKAAKGGRKAIVGLEAETHTSPTIHKTARKEAEKPTGGKGGTTEGQRKITHAEECCSC